MVAIKSVHFIASDEMPSIQAAAAGAAAGGGTASQNPKPTAAVQRVHQSSHTQPRIRHSPLPPQLSTMNATTSLSNGDRSPNGIHELSDRGRLPIITSVNNHSTYRAQNSTTPTTAISLQNTSPSARTLSPTIEPVELLRQTLQSAPNIVSNGRSGSRKVPLASKVSRDSKMFASNGFAENPEGDGLRMDLGIQEPYTMRHGFEDEYNSEDYLGERSPTSSPC
jgi:hypothetical protein